MPFIEVPTPPGVGPSVDDYLPGSPPPPGQLRRPSNLIEVPGPPELLPKPGAPKTPDPLQVLRNTPDLRQQVLTISRGLNRPAPEVESLIAQRASATGETAQSILQELNRRAKRSAAREAAPAPAPAPAAATSDIVA